MIASLRTRIAGILLILSVPAAAAVSDGMKPVFVGRPQGYSEFERHLSHEHESKLFSYSYMTAAEMQSTIISLTGFYHPAFEAFADVLGRFDPRTGQRTNDRPSLISVLFMQKISSTIADSVVEREIFLDDDERIVFTHVDLKSSPSAKILEAIIVDLYDRWLGVRPGSPVTDRLQNEYRLTEKAQGTSAAYKWLLSMMLRHGGLFYY